MLLSLIGTGVTGKELEARLDDVHITLNKNTVPNEPLSPFVTSGVRIGTPAATTRGLNEADFEKLQSLFILPLPILKTKRIISQTALRKFAPNIRFTNK